MKTMNIGGAERSLLGLLNAFDHDHYDVSLMLYQHTGEFLKFIPKEVKLLPVDSKYSTIEVPIKSLLFSKRFMYGLARMLGKIEFYMIEKLLHGKKDSPWIKQQYTHKYLTPLLPKIKGEYDLAINFLGISDILVKKVEAKVKAGWIHTDYGQLVVNEKMDLNVYSKLDHIVNVSEDSQRVFLKHYPQLKEKAIVIENILSVQLIEEQSEEFNVEKEMPKINDCKRLLSIGRFGYAKNFDNIPEICKIIRDNGMKVKWYIIGYGNDEEMIKKKIKQFGMQEDVIILGKKVNPYPYIKACDIYVQPSRYEGKAVTVREAQILHKPVIITNYETANCQLINDIDGIIVPLDSEGCANEMVKIMANDEKLKKMVDAQKKMDYSNESEINKIYALIKYKVL